MQTITVITRVCAGFAAVCLSVAVCCPAQTTSPIQSAAPSLAGKLADLMLVDGDPTTDIHTIRKTELVLKNGVIYKPSELYSALGVSP